MFSEQAAEEYLVEVVSQASDDAAAALQGDPKNIEVVKKSMLQSSLIFPGWGVKFRFTKVI